jgi:hypothetical protein
MEALPLKYAQVPGVRRAILILKPNGSLRKRKREKNYVGIKYHINIDFPNDLIELHNFADGYCGISKIENNRYCLCYLSGSENLKKYKGDIKKMEEQVLMKNPFFKRVFQQGCFFCLMSL